MRWPAIGSLTLLFRRAPKRALGSTSRSQARLLVEREQLHGDAPPDGCEWLDAETVADLELERVSAAVDRTVTPLGAQQLWRMIVGPAQRRDVLERRERIIRELTTDPRMRGTLKACLERISSDAAAFVPHVLWGDAPRLPVPRWLCAVLPLALVGSALAVTLWPKLLVFSLGLLFVNVLVDHHVKNEVQHQTDAI